jgi:hypothetical protein
MLHHSLTAVLIYFSYVLHLLPIGAVVMLVHDVTDLSVSVFKVLVDVTHYVIQFSAYFQMLFLWMYLRLYYFPVHIIGTIIGEIREWPDETYHQYFAVTIVIFLMGLALMHVFWFYVMLKGIYSRVKKIDWRETISMESKVNRGAN